MKLWPIFFILFSLATLLHFPTNLIADPDSLYHMRHASVYRDSGLFDSSFPWTQFSSINAYGTDLWYGFHIFLLPFSFTSNMLLELQLAGFAVTAGAMILYYSAFRYAGISLPSIWTLILFISSSQFLFRASMLRPHTLTSALSTLLVPCFFFGPVWSIFLIAFLISFIHSTVFWIPLVIASVTTLGSLLFNKKRYWWQCIGAWGGVLLGLLARPNPLGIFPLLRIQLFDMVSTLSNAVPLSIGPELKPFTILTLCQQYLPIACLAIGLFFYLHKHELRNTQLYKTHLFMSTASVALIFLCLSFFVARRFIDIGNAFLILTIGIVATPLALNLTARKHRALTITIISSLSLLAVYTGFLTYHEQRLYRIDPFAMQKPALWLRDHAQPKDIVFHAHWDDFPKLFFWNTHSYYINGMDPIFLYSFNSSLYYKQLYYAIDKATAYTCPKDRCSKKEIENTEKVLTQDLRASYIVLDKHRNPNLIKYLAGSPAFAQTYSDEQYAIFQTSIAHK